MCSEWVADHMVSVFWITDDLRSDLSGEKRKRVFLQHSSSNIHANKTNRPKLNRKVEAEKERREREREQNDRRVRRKWTQRKRRKGTEREGDFSLGWSLMCKDRRAEFPYQNKTHLPTVWQSSCTRENSNFYLRENMTLPGLLIKVAKSEYVTTWGKTGGVACETVLSNPLLVWWLFRTFISWFTPTTSNTGFF